jgi:hypothetical protein
VRRVPARRRAPLEAVALALEQLAHRLERGARFGRVEIERGRVGEAHVIAADMPVARRDEAPGEFADVDAVALCRLRGERQAAVGALPAGGCGERAFVRRREAQRIGFVMPRRCELREHAFEVRQRQVVQHLRGRVRQRRREGDQQVHAPDYPVQRRAQQRWRPGGDPADDQPNSESRRRPATHAATPRPASSSAPLDGSGTEGTAPATLSVKLS